MTEGYRERRTGLGSALERHFERVYAHILQPTAEAGRTDSEPATKEAQQERVIEHIKQLMVPQRPAPTLEEIRAVVAHCQTPSEAGAKTSAIPLGERERQLLLIAQAAGLVSVQAITPEGVILKPSANALRKPASQQLALLTVLALHASSAAPELSHGWNGRLVPGELIYRHVASRPAEKQQFGARRPLYMTGLASGGHLVAARSTYGNYQQEEFFFSPDEAAGRALRQSAQYQTWMAEHRVNEPEAKLAMAQAYKQAEPMKIPTIPKALRLIGLPALEEIALEHGLSLLSMAKLGYALVAMNGVTNFYQTSGESKHANNGRKRKHYFVAQERAALQRWAQTEEYREWIEGNGLTKLLLQQWAEAVQPRCVEPATFLPEDQQPAWVVEESTLQADNQYKFDLSHLSAEGYIAQLASPYYLFWQDPEKGKRHKQSLREQVPTDSRAEQLKSADRLLWKNRLRQLMEQPDWPPAPAHIEIPPEFSDVRLIQYRPLEELALALPPLTIGGLKRRGFLLDAQTSKTRPGMGWFYVCPDGLTQYTALQATQWYKDVQADQRQRSYDNIRQGSPAAKSAENQNPAE